MKYYIRNVSRTKFLTAFTALICAFAIIAGTAYSAYLVPELPSDNLLTNPWFRDNSNKPSLQGWTDATGPQGFWVAAAKDGNPTPINIIGTSARVSAGANGSYETLPPYYDAYLYQVVAADPTQTTLSFDLYWVAHTINPAEVTLYGSNTSTGNWVQVWKPFNKAITSTLYPPSGQNHNYWLWNYYSDTTDMVTKTIPQGYPYYKVEFHVNFPDNEGGFKTTGVYFSTGTSNNTEPAPQPEPEPTPVPVPVPEPTPDPTPEPGQNPGSDTNRGTTTRDAKHSVRDQQNRTNPRSRP